MASPTDTTRFRLASSILRFLQDELKVDGITPDKAESLEVAIQCLRLAYEIPEEEDLSGENSIMDIYVKAVPQDFSPPSDEDKNKAEELKQQGNELMKSEDFEQAIENYTSAISIDPHSAVYYCNRAAAYTGLGQHESALADCRKAVRIDQNYSKAYSRMGLIYSKIEKYEMAVDCYDKALKLDPKNEGYRNNMKIAQDKLKESAQPAGGFPGFGGSGGMADMLNNPGFMSMAQQVMTNPAMQQMAMNMMSGFMGGGAPQTPREAEIARNPEAAQPPPPGPDIAEMLQIGQQFAARLTETNPELVSSLRNQMNQGQPQQEDSPQS